MAIPPDPTLFPTVSLFSDFRHIRSLLMPANPVQCYRAGLQTVCRLFSGHRSTRIADDEGTKQAIGGLTIEICIQWVYDLVVAAVVSAVTVRPERGTCSMTCAQKVAGTVPVLLWNEFG